LRAGSLVRVLVCAVVGLPCGTARLEAHDLGTTHLDVASRLEHTEITLYGDARALLLRASTPVDAGATPDEMRAALVSAATRLAELVRLTCDGRAVRLAQADVRWESVDRRLAAIRLRAAPLAGECTLAYDGALLPYAMVLHDARGQIAHTEWIAAGGRSTPFRANVVDARAVAETGARYLRLGFTHIVPFGLDHVLFVLGIFFSSSRWRAVLAQVTAFTVAHSVTLALAMLNVVHAAPAFVEPLIAVSIVYVALENLTATELRLSRVAVVFAFGLLHGLGFAGVLAELGLPAGQLAPALIGFNVGVELGQLAVIGAAAATLAALRPVMASPRQRIAVPASVIIGTTGAYWTVLRLGVLG
jgi:hypothetical protein